MKISFSLLFALLAFSCAVHTLKIEAKAEDKLKIQTIAKPETIPHNKIIEPKEEEKVAREAEAEIQDENEIDLIEELLNGVDKEIELHERVDDDDDDEDALEDYDSDNDLMEAENNYQDDEYDLMESEGRAGRSGNRRLIIVRRDPKKQRKCKIRIRRPGVRPPKN